MLVARSHGFKVCHLTSVHPWDDTRIFHKMCRSLAGAGHEVHLVCARGPEVSERYISGVHIHRISDPVSRLARIFRTTRGILAMAESLSADIYHFHDPELIPIGLLLKRHGKRVIYDVHEDVPRQNLSKPYIPVVFRKPISLMIGALEAFSAQRFDGVVTATPFINRRFLELGANAVNVNNYPIASELNPDENQWEDKEKAVCYVGVITGLRGAFEMVEAVGKTGYKLLLAGNIELGLESRLRLLPGWRQVEVLGFVDREGVRATAARSMAGLVLFHPEPNHIDAQPNKMFEYMSAGIPVIASDFPLWKKIVIGADCGICVDPISPQEIAEAIRWVIENPNRAKELGKQGRQAIIDRYNWENEAKKLIKIYTDLDTQFTR